MERGRRGTPARAAAWLAAPGLVLLCLAAIAPIASAAPTGSGSATIEVFVDQPTTTTAPPPTTTTQAPPAVTTIPPTTTTMPTTTTEPPSTTTSLLTTDQSLADELPPVSVPTTSPSTTTGVVGSVKSAVKATGQLVKGVLSGKPVADVAQQVLPPAVAQVVVPAVRTASTFVFPIGLAGAVVAFLFLQQRIDSGDPKLAAAPMAHDDDVVTFQ